MHPPIITLVTRPLLNRQGREQILKQIRHVIERYSGRLTGLSGINEIAFTRRMAERLPPEQIAEARSEAPFLVNLMRA